MTPILGDLIKSATDLAGKFIPDADKRLEFELELQKLADQAAVREQELLQGQIEIDKIEAASENLFVAGWRPFIGWTCGASLAYTWMIAPIAKAVFHLTELPVIDPSQIYPIVTAMLGIAGLRSFEKYNGVPSGVTQAPAPPKQPSIVSKVGSWFK
jgi:hypothetical protein